MNPNLLIVKKWHFGILPERKTTREEFKFNTNFTYILILFFIGFLWIYYVWTLNSNATKGYNLRKLEIEKRNLSIEKELLEVKIAELSSLSHLMKSSMLKNMEKIKSPEYLVYDDKNHYVFNY